MKAISFDQALKELQSIAHDIEQGKVTVEEMEKSIKRSKELLEFCQHKLRQIEEMM